MVRVHLVDAFDVILDRVLDRHQVAVDAADLGERRVERRGLARAGGAGDQEHAVRQVDRLLECLERFAFEPELVGVPRERLLVEEPEHDLFAVGGGQRRYPDVDFAVGQVHREPAVLGQQPHRDVQLRQHLDARHDRHLEILGRLHHLVQHAVDAVAHRHSVAQRLDVDVARPRVDRLRQHQVHEPHHRGVLDLLPQRGEIDIRLQVLGTRQVERFNDLGRLLGGPDPLVGAFDRLAHVARPRQPDLELAAGQRAQVVERHDVQRVADRDLERGIAAPECQHQRLAGQMLGHDRHRVGLGLGQRLGVGDRQ